MAVRTASTTRPPPAPMSEARHDRVTATATTMATISMTSMAAARKVETKTPQFMVAAYGRAAVSDRARCSADVGGDPEQRHPFDGAGRDSGGGGVAARLRHLATGA